MNDTRNQVVSEICALTKENAADVSEILRAYYDLRLKYLKTNPGAVAQFDAEELQRAEGQAEAAIEAAKP